MLLTYLNNVMIMFPLLILFFSNMYGDENIWSWVYFHCLPLVLSRGEVALMALLVTNLKLFLGSLCWQPLEYRKWVGTRLNRTDSPQTMIELCRNCPYTGILVHNCLISKYRSFVLGNSFLAFDEVKVLNQNMYKWYKDGYKLMTQCF